MLVVTSPLKREHALIGKALEKESPEIYNRLKQLFFSIEPQQADFNKVPAYFILYCTIYNISPNPSLNTPDDRRFFIAAMLHIYRPELFHQTIKVRTRTGLSKMLYETLSIDEGNLSKAISQVIVWNRSDDEFKSKVLDIVKELTRQD